MAKNIKNQNVAKVWKTAAYIRLSREDGDKTESESVINQKQIIGDFITTQPDLGGYSEFIDDGATGTNFNRQGFQRMLEEIKSGNINCVVVKDLSRFGRNYNEAGTYMEQIFPMFGVRFISITDHIDSYARPAEMDSILVPLKNLLNDSYSRDLSVKIKSAMTAKRSRGEFIGAFAVYGYIRDPDDKNRIIVDDEAAEIVKSIYEWYTTGSSKMGIVRKLNELKILTPAKYRISKYPPKKKHDREYAQNLFGLWSIQAVSSILENPTYCGHMAQGKRTTASYKNSTQIKTPKEAWIIKENTHDAIIDEAVFRKAQELSQLTVRECPNKNVVYLFSGLMRCADCGRGMDRTTVRKDKTGKVYASYRCSTYFRHSKEACTGHTIPERLISEAVLAAVQAHIAVMLDTEAVIREVDIKKRNKSQSDVFQTQLISAQRELDSIERIKLGLYTDLKKDIITQDEYVALKTGYTEQITALTQTVENLKAEIKNLNHQESAQDECFERFRKYKNIDTLNRTLVTDLIERIDVHENSRRLPSVCPMKVWKNTDLKRSRTMSRTKKKKRWLKA